MVDLDHRVATVSNLDDSTLGGIHLLGAAGGGADSRRGALRRRGGRASVESVGEGCCEETRSDTVVQVTKSPTARLTRLGRSGRSGRGERLEEAMTKSLAADGETKVDVWLDHPVNERPELCGCKSASGIEGVGLARERRKLTFRDAELAAELASGSAMVCEVGKCQLSSSRADRS